MRLRHFVTLFICLGNSEETDTPEIALPCVKSSSLTKIVEFLKHHAESPLGDIPKVILELINQY